MKLDRDAWNLKHLHAHLQYAVSLELWTIPFYMSALFSIRDRSSPAFQLIQSIVNQICAGLSAATTWFSVRVSDCSFRETVIAALPD